jgi:hypothetical protein
MKAELVTDCRDWHGEGLFWSAEHGLLFWTDIFGQRISTYDPARRDLRRYKVPGRVQAGVIVMNTDNSDAHKKLFPIVTLATGLFPLGRHSTSAVFPYTLPRSVRGGDRLTLEIIAQTARPIGRVTRAGISLLGLQFNRTGITHCSGFDH